MKSILLAAALCIVAAPVWAGTIGHDFCTAMQQQHVACITEAVTKDDNGNFLKRCPAAAQEISSSYLSAMKQADSNLKSEIQKADGMWLEITKDVMPKSDETRDQYLKRTQARSDAIAQECQRLRALD